MTLGLRVVEVGRATTVQDLGRSGFAHLGVPRAGAVDRASSALANRLVGNRMDAAVLETNGGLLIQALRPLVVATSADGHRHTLGSGTLLRVDPADHQMWAYLAVRGGLDVGCVLGSRSHDSLSGLGPDPLEDGLDLPVGADPGSDLLVDLAPVRPGTRPIRIWPGPRAGRVVDSLAILVSRPWTVSASVSRVGVRLEAGPLHTDGPERLASEGIVEGAIQITPAGEPIVMLANHPTTGGYPVVAVVDPDDIAMVAQSRPGATLQFTPHLTPHLTPDLTPRFTRHFTRQR